MAIQKKSLIENRTATKKALVASRPASSRPEASRPVAERKDFMRPTPMKSVAQRRKG
jgi:hypothetical protein